jgi:tetratricopeptide (TPR) repeat protein
MRVFVSSTFRDMQGEREELVKRVFPELRRRCEQRGVAWSEIDLRWGVTDEAKAEGAVLPICLREIELSRPYFIGMLGQRYGWVPDEIPADLATREGWLDDDRDRSVTELEILHGVLNDPDMAGHAFFYVRDPAWAERLPADTRATYVDDDPVAQHRLADLRDRLRASEFPVTDYAEPRAIGALVEADLGALIDELFPADQVIDPLAGEAEAHRAFGAARFAGYVDRPAVTASLDQASVGGRVVVTGDEGAGKSALLASWCTERAATIVHHVGATADSAEWPAIIRRLLRHLGNPADDVAALELPKRLVTTLATTAVKTPLTIVIDGLDQVEPGDRTPLFWLPDPPANITIVTSAGPGPELDELRRRGWDEVAVDPLTNDERRAITTSFLARWAKALDPMHVDRLAGAPQTANPLFLRTVLDELRQWGDHFTLGARIDAHLGAPDLAALFGVVLARYETDFDRDRPGLVRDSMRALWAGYRGVTEAELLDLLGTDEPLPRAVWSPLFLAAEANLLSHNGRLTFAHQSMRDAVVVRHVPTSASGRLAHSLFADLLTAMELSPRVVEELPHQLAGAARWDELATWLARPDTFDAIYRHGVPELQLLWSELESASSHRAAATYRSLSADPALSFQVAVLLAGRGQLADAIAATDAAMLGHRASGARRPLIGCLINRGAWQVQVDDLDGADAAYGEALELARAEGDRFLEQTAVGGLGMVRRARRDLEGALAMLQEQEAIAVERGDIEGQEMAIANQGSVLLDRNDFAGAAARYEDAERLARQLGDPSLLGQVLSAQAVVLAAQGFPDEAAARHREHADEARQRGDRYELSIALGNHASALVSLGRRDEAIALLAEATDLARDIGDQDVLARHLLLGAMIAHQQGQPERALTLLDEHAAVCESIADRAALANGIGERATILRERGDLDGAARLHAQEERLHLEAGSATGVATSMGNQALVALARGDVGTALELLADQERRCREVGWVEGLVAALGNRASLLAQTGDITGSIAVLRQRADALRGTNLAVDRLRTLADLGGFLLDTGQAAAALAVLLEAEPLARADAADPSDRQRVIGRLGLALLQSGRPDDGEKYLREQESMCRASGDVAGLAAALQNLALVAHSRGDFASALALTDEQLPLSQQAGDGMGFLMGTANRGELLCRLGRTGEGLGALAQAEQWAQQNGLAPLAQQIAALAAGFRSS